MSAPATNRDFLYEVIVRGGATVTFRSRCVDGSSVFSAKSDYPADDDPRFPALFRFPVGQTAQVDIVSIEPIVPDDSPLLTEAGFPIKAEAPESAIYPE